MNLPRGSQVFPAAASQAIASGAGGVTSAAGGTSTIVLTLDGRTVAQQLVRVYRQTGGTLGIAPA